MARKNVDALQSAAGQIGSLISDLLRQRDEVGLTAREFHVLFTPAGEEHRRKMLEGLKAKIIPATPLPVYLRQMCADEEILLTPTDGTKTIAQAKNVFSWGIDSDFTNWDLDVVAAKTTTTKVSVQEMFERDGTFEEIYGSLGHPLDRLCLTQHQIINFCVMHKDKLRQGGYGTFFLFKVGGKFFVALVRVFAVGALCANVFRFSHGLVWLAEYRLRFVIPQL